jgi:hypothetical protein
MSKFSNQFSGISIHVFAPYRYPGYVESQVNMSQEKCEYFTAKTD